MSVSLNREQAGAWTVEGELTFSSVPLIQEASLDWFASPPSTLDLGQVGRIDSAGIALLIEWARRARLAGAEMRLINVPTGMMSLAETAGLNQVLNIDGAS